MSSGSSFKLTIMPTNWLIESFEGTCPICEAKEATAKGTLYPEMETDKSSPIEEFFRHEDKTECRRQISN